MNPAPHAPPSPLCRSRAAHQALALLLGGLSAMRSSRFLTICDCCRCWCCCSIPSPPCTPMAGGCGEDRKDLFPAGALRRGDKQRTISWSSHPVCTPLPQRCDVHVASFLRWASWPFLCCSPPPPTRLPHPTLWSPPVLHQAGAAMEWMQQLRKIQIPSPLLYNDCINICGTVGGPPLVTAIPHLSHSSPLSLRVVRTPPPSFRLCACLVLTQTPLWLLFLAWLHFPRALSCGGVGGQTGDITMAEEFFKMAKEDGMTDDGHVFAGLIRAYARCKMVGLGESMRLFFRTC